MCPRLRPASAAKATGVYGARKVVTPRLAIGTPSSSDVMPEDTTPDVLP